MEEKVRQAMNNTAGLCVNKNSTCVLLFLFRVRVFPFFFVCVDTLQRKTKMRRDKKKEN